MTAATRRPVRASRRASRQSGDARRGEEENVHRARDAEATVREETGAEAEGTRTRALEARLVESETLRDGMRDALATLKEKYETMAMVMAGAVEARRGGFTSAEMKREVGLAKAAASEERARRMRAEADVEAAERRAREATAERNEARMMASARAASGSSAGVATTERVAALEEALAAAKREAKSLKQTCDRQKRELVKARARIASLETSIAGDAAGTPSRASPRERAPGSTSRAVSRRARAAASPAVDDRATKSPNTVAESREPSFPAIVANWNAPFPERFHPSAARPRSRRPERAPRPRPNPRARVPPPSPVARPIGRDHRRSSLFPLVHLARGPSPPPKTDADPRRALGRVNISNADSARMARDD